MLRVNRVRSKRNSLFPAGPDKQEKTITVDTTANPQQPTILKLHVYIEETVKIEPEFVLWRVGEQPDPEIDPYRDRGRCLGKDRFGHLG